ncbi:helix-turn-helix domain-containing protein [Rhodococcus sp. 14-2470-1a]|uniref:helix-turn-helix domain-containing protein n=1 Tax=Rhodococcus sp. 14-2470-1a TaxID=2023150 RepID=UPI00117B0C65|nr:helix-turn-helix transcriptional regulator [Rhodococcus sp. 14-2470-1a]
MPNIDEDARRWQMEISANAAAGLRYWRQDVRGITAATLARRCSELGFPVTRVAISKIENNSRQGKLEVSELIVLARALRIAPVQLLYPHIPDGRVEYLPHSVVRETVALDWFVGRGKMHLDAHDQKLLEIAQRSSPDELSENRRKLDENREYDEAVLRVQILDELGTLEQEAAQAFIRLRHPSLAGDSEQAVKARDAIGQRLTKVMADIDGVLYDLKSLGMVVNDEDHRYG